MELFNPFKNLAVFLYYATIQTVLKGWCFIYTARYHNRNRETILPCFMFVLTNSWQPENYLAYELMKKQWKKNGIAGGGVPCTFSCFIVIFLYYQARYI